MAQSKRTARPPKAKITNAVAAQRAAQIFGAPDSLFTGRARVSAKGLQNGLNEMVARVYANAPNVAPMVRGFNAQRAIRLTYIGESAMCRYTWEATNPKLRATAVINLPATGEDDHSIARSIADQYTAYALHELGHVLFTPLGAFRDSIQSLAYKHRVSESFAKGIINALEDVAIERNIIAHGYAPGAATMLRALLMKCVNDIPRAEYGTMGAFSCTLAFGLRGYAPNAAALVNALPPALRRIYDAAGRALDALPLRAVGDYDAMQGVVDAADGVLAALRALADAQPKQPKQPKPQPEPGEGEPGEGEPGEGEPGEGEPGEGEPGEGEPAEGTEEPGEGEPGEGEPAEGTGEPGEGEPAEGTEEPGEGEPGEGEPAEGTGEPGADDPTPQEVGNGLQRTPRSSDMQPDAAGDPADGASGLTNDALVVKVESDMGQHSAETMTGIATRTLGKAPKVTQALRQLLDASAYDSKEGGRRSGALRTSALHRVATGADTVFERRSYRDGSDSAVTLLIDMSSSMNCRGGADDPAILHARNLAAALARLLSQSAGTAFECLGFNTSGGSAPQNTMAQELIKDIGSSDDRHWLQKCVLHVFKTFKDAPAVAMRRLESCMGAGGTPDAAAIVAACERLLQQPAERRIFIMLADGEGSTDEVLSKILRKYEARGVICIGVGIGQDMNDAFQYRARVDDAAQLGASSFATLLTAVARDHAYHGGGDD